MLKENKQHSSLPLLLLKHKGTEKRVLECDMPSSLDAKMITIFKSAGNNHIDVLSLPNPHTEAVQSGFLLTTTGARRFSEHDWKGKKRINK